MHSVSETLTDREQKVINLRVGINNLEEKVAYHQCQIKYYFSPLAKNEFHSIPIPYIQQLLLCNLFFLN